ncbi:MAG TPA: HlyD family secretion protein [Terriglobales bacterium]
MPELNEEQKRAAREPWPEEEEAPQKKSYLRQHPGVRIGLIFVLIILAVVGVFVWRYFAVRESTDDAQIDGHITPISSRVSGTVIKLNFDDNQYVQAGQVLVQLDPKDYEVAVARAQADLADAESGARAAETNVPITHINTASQLETAQAALNAAQKDVDAAHARLREAEAKYVKVHKDLERIADLVKKDEVSRQQYDAAVAADASANATVDTARAQVAATESRVAQAKAGVNMAGTAPQQVAVTRSRFSSAQALVLMRRAALEQAQLNLQYTTVRAPANGVVSKRSVEVGQVISPGQPLAALVDLDNIYVTANFKETQLKNMKIGQPVTIKVDAYDRDLKGHVDSFGGATGARFSLLPPENATGNYVKVVQRVPVKIVFERGEDTEHKLRPGMSVVPTVLTK